MKIYKLRWFAAVCAGFAVCVLLLALFPSLAPFSGVIGMACGGVS